MDQPLKKTNILILRGVYPKDFAPVDNIYEKTNPDVDRSKIEPAIVYTDMPKKFTSVATWPRFSNLKCCECDQLPTSYPKFIPQNPEKDNAGEDICDVFGHFCEWNCAVRFAQKEFPKEQQPDILQYICLFESKFSGKRKEKIMPCPRKTEMKAYCGNNGITPKQWREKLDAINNDYSLTNYKLEHFREVDFV